MAYILFPVMLTSLASLSFISVNDAVMPVLGLLIYPFVMVILPIIDLLLRPLNKAQESLRTNLLHEIALGLTFPMVAGLILASLWHLGSGDFSTIDAVMMGLSIGMASGAIGMTAAHEMIHRASAYWRAVGVGILICVQYGHFRIEHIHGHHIHVGTLKDPATARKGEGFYHFFIRVLKDSYLSAWAIEARRISNRKKPLLSVENRMLHYLCLQIALIIGAYMLAGTLGLVMLATQTFIALILTEAVDYIQHYGLMRTLDETGRLEPVRHHHSWNSRHAAGDWTTFNIGLHSHHHSSARTPYAELSQDEEHHEMPGNYAVMIAMALLPPLWFHVMDKRL